MHRLSHHLGAVDFPKPMALLCTLFRLRPPKSSAQQPDEPLFQGLRVWTDVVDICENESFGTCFKSTYIYNLTNI